MRLFDDLGAALSGFFDRKVSFYRPTGERDSTGQLTGSYEPVDGMQGVTCAVGDRNASKQSNERNSYGTQEQRDAILLPGPYGVQVGWKAVLDTGDEYRVTESTQNQSGDVTEVAVGRWL